jgi:predicted metalloprotease with PDZ domain
MPAWIPGSYMIRDFARNLLSIHSVAGDRRVGLTKLDKQTWRLDAAPGPVEVVCEVYAHDLSVRSAWLDRSRAYFNGTSLLLRVEGAEDVPCTIDMVPPDGPFAASWRVATTLNPVGVDERGFGRYLAGSYWDAIDHPVEWGVHATASFEVEGVAHRIAVSGQAPRGDLARLASDLKEVCAGHARLFGTLPVPEYLFLLHLTGDGYGGLEHCRSTSLLACRDDLPAAGESEVDEGYRRLLGLCSHEYFHLWNVKRIRPGCFFTPDLAGEVHTSLLWAFEGVTSYYDDLMLVRTGRIAPQSYLELVARSVSRLLRTPGRRRQSIADASFDAWTKLYKPDENSPNAGVSYYLKGGLVAWGLDAELRLATGDGATLDDLMRLLWRRYGATGEGVAEGDLERLAAELAGRELRSFFDRYVYGTDELPIGDWCAAFGLGVRLRAARDERDEGGSLTAAPVDAPPARRTLAVRTKAGSDGVTLLTVFDDGPAQRAGLAAGDVVVAVGGQRASADTFSKLVARAPADRPLLVHAFRGGELVVFEVDPAPAPQDTCELWLLPDDALSSAGLARRAQWLHG